MVRQNELEILFQFDDIFFGRICCAAAQTLCEGNRRVARWMPFTR